MSSRVQIKESALSCHVHLTFLSFHDIILGEGIRKIYVGNLPFEADKGCLIELFSQHGTVKDVYIPLDMASGRSRGFAFVTMDEADADNAIEETNGRMFMGRELAVSVPLPRGQKAPTRQGAYRCITHIATAPQRSPARFSPVLDTVLQFYRLAPAHQALRGKSFVLHKSGNGRGLVRTVWNSS